MIIDIKTKAIQRPSKCVAGYLAAAKVLRVRACAVFICFLANRAGLSSSADVSAYNNWHYYECCRCWVFSGTAAFFWCSNMLKVKWDATFGTHTVSQNEIEHASCHLTMDGDAQVWAHDLYLPIRVGVPKFQCQLHLHAGSDHHHISQLNGFFQVIQICFNVSQSLSVEGGRHGWFLCCWRCSCEFRYKRTRTASCAHDSSVLHLPHRAPAF